MTFKFSPYESVHTHTHIHIYDMLYIVYVNGRTRTEKGKRHGAARMYTGSLETHHVPSHIILLASVVFITENQLFG